MARFEPPPRLTDKYAGKEARPVPNMGIPAIYAGKFAGGTAKGDAKPKQKKAKAEAKPKPKPAIERCCKAISAAWPPSMKTSAALLATLDELKLAENTVVVFASDNGYYLGEHNLGDKRSAYDESLRIPLLVRCPKLGEKARGKTVDQMALNLDLAPTLLDLAGVKIPDIDARPKLAAAARRQRRIGQLADGVLLRVFLRAQLRDSHRPRRPHRHGQAHQVSRPRRLDRAVRPRPPIPTRRRTSSAIRPPKTCSPRCKPSSTAKPKPSISAFPISPTRCPSTPNDTDDRQ